MSKHKYIYKGKLYEDICVMSDENEKLLHEIAMKFESIWDKEQENYNG